MRRNFTVTLNPGVPINIARDLLKTGDQNVYLSRIFVQPAHTGTGNGVGAMVYIMDGVPWGTAADKANALHVTAELTGATEETPGASYTDAAFVRDAGGIDPREFNVDGEQADPVRISLDRRV